MMLASMQQQEKQEKHCRVHVEVHYILPWMPYTSKPNPRINNNISNNNIVGANEMK